MTVPATVPKLRHCARFVAAVTLAHLFTYITAGMLAYFFVYEAQMEAGLLDANMRDINNPEEWHHVETWLLPAQLLRGLLMGLALLPFAAMLARWPFRKRFLALFGLLLVFSVWSVTMPGPGSIEGWLYLKPDDTPLPNPLLGYIEVPSQLAIFALLVAWRIGRQGWKDEESL